MPRNADKHLKSFEINREWIQKQIYKTHKNPPKT